MNQHNEKSMVDLFAKIENSLPVESYVIDGIKIWPYMRLSIKNKLDAFFLDNGGHSGQPNKQPSFQQKLKQVISTLQSAIMLSGKALIQFPFRQWFSSQRIDYLMCSFNSSFLQAGDNEVNRNLVGIQQGLEQSGNKHYKILEYTSLSEVKHKPNFPGFNIAPLSAALNEWCRFHIAFSAMFRQAECSFVDEVNEYLESHDCPVKLESFKLRHETRRIELMSRILQIYIKRHRIQKVINVCYYGYLGMAINLACYRQKIASIEYQHGVQTQFHPMYSNWQNVPDTGFELLPEEFWVWGPATHEVINKWVRRQTFHKVKTVGNTWLEYYRRQLKDSKSLTASQIQRYQGRKLVLVSLQAYPEHYQLHVTEAMRQSGDEWLWILKEHPRFPLTVTQLEEEFGELIANGKVTLERDFTIYEMLTLLPVCVHLTAFSTVAFECEYFGVPTIFFHPNGIDGNSELIDKAQHLFAACDADTLLACIENATHQDVIEPVYMAREITAIDELRSERIHSNLVLAAEKAL